MSDDEEAMLSDDDSNASYMSEGGEGSGGQTSEEEDNDDHGYGSAIHTQAVPRAAYRCFGAAEVKAKQDEVGPTNRA
jgi:hypothetical protein